MALVNCSECGREISDRASACPHCGCPVEVVPTEDEIRNQTIMRLLDEDHVSEKKKRNKLLVFCAILMLIILIISIAAKSISSPKRNFNNLTGIIIGGDTCVISDDGKTMILDTNPDDVDDVNYGGVLYDIENINSQLGVSYSVIEKMKSTRALDGRQVESYGNITISWTYHPKTGLEVVYEIN